MEISPKPSSPRTWSQSIVKMSPMSWMSPSSRNRRTVRSPKPSMSSAPRDAKCSIAPCDLGRALRGRRSGCRSRPRGAPACSPQARAGGRGTPTACEPLRPVGQHRADDLGDDVAGPAHDHRVARPHVLGPHLVLVVQGGLARRWRRRRTPARAGRTAWPARCGRPTRGCRAAWWCAPRAGTCRRSPTAAPGCVKPSSPRRREVVDLHDHAVDLVVEVVAVLLPALAVRLHLVEVRQHGDLGVDRQAEPPQEVERLVVAGEARDRPRPRRAGSTRSRARGWR